MRKGTKFAVGTAVAAGMGYVAGLLTAPKSGKQTRKEIHDKALQAKKDLNDKLHHLNEELTSTIVTAKDKLKGLETGAKTELQKALDHAVIAKDKAKDMMQAIKTGDADDKDLKNAVKDVHKAIDNLKKYIDKNG